MVLTEDGGTWAAHTAHDCSEQLQEVLTSVNTIKEKQSELLKKLKEEFWNRNDGLLATLVNSMPHHREDVTFLKAANRHEEEAKRYVLMHSHSCDTWRGMATKWILKLLCRDQERHHPCTSAGWLARYCCKAGKMEMH